MRRFCKIVFERLPWSEGSNEYHKPYFPKKCVLENVTNLSHAISYFGPILSPFWPNKPLQVG